MGRIKSKLIKNFSKKILKEMNSDRQIFINVKKFLNKKFDKHFFSKKLRNIAAGYVVRISKKKNTHVG